MPSASRLTKAWHRLGGDVRIDTTDVPMSVLIREDHAGLLLQVGKESGASLQKAGDPIPEGINLSRMGLTPDDNVGGRGEKGSGLDAWMGASDLSKLGPVECDYVVVAVDRMPANPRLRRRTKPPLAAPV